MASAAADFLRLSAPSFFLILIFQSPDAGVSAHKNTDDNTRRSCEQEHQSHARAISISHQPD